MRFLCALCVLCGLGSSTVAIDREAFTFTKYDLEIRLEPEQQRLGARGKITLRNDSTQPQKIAVLQISSSLAWRSIKVDGKAVQFVSQPYASDIDHTAALSEAIVTLPAEIKPKDSVEIEVGYEGTIVQDGTRLTQIGIPEDIARHSSWDQISPSFTAVRGAGYVAWYPIATESADFSEGNSMFQVADRWRAREADSSMKLWIGTAAGERDANLLLFCNGAGISADTREGTAHFYHTDCDYQPLGPTTPAFASAHLVDKRSAGRSVPVGIYALDGHEEGAATYAASIVPAAEFVTRWFGTPRNVFEVVDLPDGKAASFESGNMLFVPMAADDPKLATLNLIHMLAHSSFQSPRPWIHEGLAHFAEAIYREQKQDGREAALDFLNLHRTTFVEAEKDVAQAPQKNPSQPLASTFDESYYRSKAAYVWWMLCDMIGEDALKQAIHNYRAADDKNPKYVEQLIAAAAKRDLGWFFDDWVYQDRGLPDFRVLAAHPWKGTKETQLVTVTIENLGGAGAEVPFTIRFGSGQITRRIEVRAKSTATTRVEVPGTAAEVVVNDGSVPESDLTNNVFKITEP
jgi:aminopeptidase N